MSTPWNGRPLAIFETKTGALGIKAADEKDPPQRVFECSDLESLFATLAGSGRRVSSDNFIMYGTERKPDGKGKAILADELRAYIAKDGSERMTSHIYSASQLDAFVPVSFAVITKFINTNGRNIPKPLFLAYALPMERSPSQNAGGFQRVTVHKAATPAGPAFERKTKLKTPA